MRPDAAFKGRSGIYIIRNLNDGKVYVGKTKCLYRRCAQYVYDFRKRAIGHINDYLCNAMSKHGIDNFEFLPVDFAPVHELDKLELEWMVTLMSTNRDHGYNLRLDTSTGMVTSPETSIKISKNLKDQWAKGLREGHSAKLTRSWAENPDRRKKQSELLGRLKTRYRYTVTDADGNRFECDYAKLKELQLCSVLSSFHRKRTDVAILKGCKIERFPI